MKKYFCLILIKFIFILSAFIFKSLCFSIIENHIKKYKLILSQYNDLNYNNKSIKQKLSEDSYKIKSLTEYQLDNINKIISNKNYVIILFYSDWCVHCKSFIPIFDEASRYNLNIDTTTNNINEYNEDNENFKFIKVNCSDVNSSSKDICINYKIKRYPTIKIFTKTEGEIDFEPPRSLDLLLESLIKLKTVNLINIKDENDYINFSNLYGNFNFIFINNSNHNIDKNFIDCYNKISNDVKYKLYFFFGLITDINLIKKILNIDISINKGVILNYNKLFKDYNSSSIELLDHKIVNYFTYDYENNKNNCQLMDNFIQNNSFPVLNKLNKIMIKRIQQQSRIVIILIPPSDLIKYNKLKLIDLNKEKYNKKVREVLNTNLNILRKSIIEKLINNKKANNGIDIYNYYKLYTFNYILLENKDDNELINYFNLNVNKDNYNILLFDYYTKKYSFNSTLELNNISLVQNELTKIIDLINNSIENNKINENKFIKNFKWKSDKIVESIFDYLGIEYNNSTILLFSISIMLIIFILVFIIVSILDNKRKLAANISRNSNSNNNTSIKDKIE